MSDILKIQEYVIGKFLGNEHTESITKLSDKCFDEKYVDLFKKIKKDYQKNNVVDITKIEHDFIEMVDLINDNMLLEFSFDSCISKLQAHRGVKANRYIGSKLASGDITEIEAIELLNQKMQIVEEDVSNGQQIAVETYQKIVERLDKKNSILTGLKNFDEIIGDLEDVGFFVIGGRPSSGKTALSLNIAEAVAKQDKKILYFSLEMTKHKIMQRIMLSHSMVDNEKVRKRTLEDQELTKLFEVCGKNFLKNIHIIDKSGMTIDDIITKSVSLHRKYKYSLIIVDYLQLVKAEGQTKREEMMNVSHGFVNLKKTLDLPIIVVASLSRGNKDSKNKKPSMSDLAESGAIEYDADTIAFVHRDFIENNEADPCDAEIVFRKQRDGTLGIAKQYFTGKFFRFSNWHVEKK
jgi:replicative DNA helicase